MSSGFMVQFYWDIDKKVHSDSLIHRIYDKMQFTNDDVSSSVGSLKYNCS